ncbi:hypothetical protein [Marinobacter sp. HL-58]|uniref:hypothetical protein n=1 Tax=Marinobacter sp. HL-58 TaxID=1479237 RepID=UPI00047F419A|nr:hypothetical protein [Marinobacter sp. HL-58]KPP97835.1 MAG: hypothetical protein HLUCCO03_09145 [Marinobacter sp. HL-58]
MDTVIVGLVTAVLGFLGGLLTPWVRWQIDKKRAVRQEKAAHISEWRKVIDQFDFDNERFGDTAWYSALRTHMQPEIIKKVEAARTVYVCGGRGDSVIKQMLLDEVARLEKGIWRE